MVWKNIVVNKDLELCYWVPKMATELFALTNRNRQYLRPWLPWINKTNEVNDSRKFILKCRKEYRKGEALELGIWYKGKLVGCIGLHQINKTSRTTAIGYWLSHDYYGQGIVTRSVVALVKYAYSILNINRIEIVAATTNTKSLAIPERLGFTKEGVKREIEFVDNRFLDYVIYSLLQREWRASLKS
jgi:ribosomal-protein-serine acetyltransferase